MKLEAKSIEDAMTQLKLLSDFAPFRFGGSWFISECGENTVLIFRSKKAIINNLIKNNAELNNIFKVGK